MKNTKQKIIDTTIQLFNKNGYATVRLPHISAGLGISLGNLTYHFPKKKQLVLAVYEHFVSELALVTKEFKAYGGLEEIDRRVRAFSQFQQRFRFFYLDLLDLERAYPAIAERHYVHIEGQIKGIYSLIIYNMEQGNFATLADMGIYERLAHQMWMTTVFWASQLAVRNKPDDEEGMVSAVWLLLSPYLTEQGRTAFGLMRELKATA